MASAGVMARYADAQRLIEAVHAARRAGYRQMEAHAPFPVPGLAEALSFRERRIPPLALAVGLTVALGGFLMQWYASVVGYPYVVGGKPLSSWPAFMLVSFELGMLAAVLSAIGTMLAGNRLPRLHHPVFDWDAFEHASADGFFLLIEDGDPVELRTFFKKQGAAEIRELEA